MRIPIHSAEARPSREVIHVVWSVMALHPESGFVCDTYRLRHFQSGVTSCVKFGTIVGVSKEGGLGAVVGVGHVAYSSDDKGTPYLHTPRACPLSMKSLGSHNAEPRFVHCMPPHHTHGSLAIRTPLHSAAGRPSRELKHCTRCLTELQPTYA